jgi:hypothetical protein
MPGAGPVILFVCLLALSAGLAVYVLSFAALCYLIVVQDTSAGLDRVVWPEEPFIDWVFRAVQMAALALGWLAPAGLLSRLLAQTWLPGEPALRFFLLATGSLWLLFPLGVLSSLSADSRWVPLRPALLGSLMRIFPSVLGFYVCTGLLLAGAAGLWYVALYTAERAVLLAAAPAGAAVLLIHARLVGRLGWLIQRRHAARSAAPRARGSARKGKGKRSRKVEARDPWAIPEERATERVPDLPVDGYGLATDEPGERAPQEQKKAKNDPESSPEPDDEGYAVAEDGAAAPPRPRGELPGGVVVSDLERRLLERGQDQHVPAVPLLSGVYTFPWYDSSLKAWLWLTLGGALLGGCVRGLAALWPR